MQPEPADHRLRPTSTVKGQCESIVPLHFQVFPAASSPRRTVLSFFSLFHFRPIIRRPSRPRPRPPILFQLFSLRTITTPSAARQTHANSRRFFRPLHPSLRMDDKKARLPARKRTFSSVQGSSSKPSVAKPNETKMFRSVFPNSLKKSCFLP